MLTPKTMDEMTQVMSHQVAKALGPEGMKQLLAMKDELPLDRAIELLQMWLSSNPRKFKLLTETGQLVPMLRDQGPALRKVQEMETDQYWSYLPASEKMEMCGLQRSL
ncbi:hypothetical protein [Geotalea sp. SG265]|uniref:hypothetical protein n=1 Tax=Geotalea sp. SG265 TaxID=2922867 RepID=UPI001FAF730B|nr:hypothetical protein [Geotalea sp. SG265]